MVLPIAAALGALAATAGISGFVYSRYEEYQEKLTDDERKEIEATLKKLGLSLDQISKLESEKEVADAIKDKLSSLGSEDRADILGKLRQHLDHDQHFQAE